MANTPLDISSQTASQHRQRQQQQQQQQQRYRPNYLGLRGRRVKYRNGQFTPPDTTQLDGRGAYRQLAIYNGKGKRVQQFANIPHPCAILEHTVLPATRQR